MNLFIVRDFARTDSSLEPWVQVWKKKRKKSILSQEALWQNKLLLLFIFSKGGGRGQQHFIAQHFNRGGGSRYSKILHWRSIFQGPDVIGPIPMEPYTTCDFPLGPGLPAPSGSVLAPSLGSVWICLVFILYVPINDISVTSGRFFLC